jgi:phosphoesterase RecJ-like protein
MPKTMNDSPLQRICDVIESRSEFLLVTHFEPDGDGIGSCLALSHLLRGRGKSAVAWVPQGVPAKYRFLPGAGEVLTECGPREVAVAVDCDGARRLGAAAETVHQAQIVIDIDHHAGHNAFGHIAWVDSRAPAAGFQVYELLKALGDVCTPEIATCLYCAVGTDSGYFRYANTSPRLLRAAAEMVECGADPKAIADATLQRYPPEVVRLAGRALAGLTVRLDGRAAVSVLTLDDFREAGTNETEGLIDHLRTVSRVDLLILMRASEEGWRVSLRSLAGVDVSRVAKALGGGGHAAAAGCTLQGSLDEAWATLEAALGAAMHDGEQG